MSLLALVGFAAFSVIGVSAPPVDIPTGVQARVAAALLSTDLGPDPEPPTTTTTTTTTPPTTTTTQPVTTTSAAQTSVTVPTTTSPAPTTPPTTTAAPIHTATTTTTTTTTTTAPPGVVGGPRDVEEWRSMVEQYFPPELVDEALAVIYCESRGNPLAVNTVSSAAGLFQFVASTWAWASSEAGWGDHGPLEPEANIASAAWLVAASIATENPIGPWAHWNCQP